MNAFFDKLRTANMYQAILHLVVLGLAVEVFVLARQNRELKSNGDQTRQADIKVGDLFPLGDLIPITTSKPVDSSVSQLIYLFTTRCPFCRLNVPSWEELKAAVAGRQVLVVGICLDASDKASQYAVENKITYDVYAPRDYVKFRQLNHINSVPTTILRSASGYAERVWIGILRKEQMKGIAEAVSATQYPPITQRRQQ